MIESGSPLLQVRDLRTYFRTEVGVARAVDGVTFEVHPGQAVCIVGESGSGKSVTALSIIGLLDGSATIETGSSITFDGKELVGSSQTALRSVRGSDIGMIYQDPVASLDPLRPVGSQLVEALRTHAKLSRREARIEAVELLKAVGISNPASTYSKFPHELSGGMCQRVMIAIALGPRPQLLIADEPTTALDVTVEAQILDLLRQLKDEFGTAILMISHDLGLVAEIADYVIVVYAGRIVEAGQTHSMLNDPQHPYTEALLRSRPRLGMDATERLPTIPGIVPNSTSWPEGCRFAPRCRHAFATCQTETPPSYATANGLAACWLVSEPDSTSNRSG